MITLVLFIVVFILAIIYYGVSIFSSTYQNIKSTVTTVQKAKEHISTLQGMVPSHGMVPREAEEHEVDSPASIENLDGVDQTGGAFIDRLFNKKFKEVGSLIDTATKSAKSSVSGNVKSFVEIGEMAADHPRNIWLDNVALTIPPSNVGITDIIFVDANRPQQCFRKCQTSPFCRFFSYWTETGSCNLHQTLQNGETTPENMIKYAYTVPFSQHWVSGYVKKSGTNVPSNL